MNILQNLETVIENILNSIGSFGPLLACFLIVIESIVPILPLAVFVTLNFITFGSVVGFIISLICTIIGCMLSFMLFRTKVNNWFNKKIKNKEKLNKLMKKISEISFGSLVVILAMPFTPAFLINIAAGLSNISKKKYLASLIIGKAFMIYFWGYVGTSLLESITNPIIILRIIALMCAAYIVSRIVNKKFNID